MPFPRGTYLRHQRCPRTGIRLPRVLPPAIRSTISTPLRGKQRNRVAPEASIYTEIPCIDRDNNRARMQLRQNHERSIRGVHALELEHQFLGACQMLRPKWLQHKCPTTHPIEQRLYWRGVAAQMITSLPKHNFRGVKRPASLGERFRSPLMPLVGLVQPSDERPCIHNSLNVHNPRGSRGRSDRGTCHGALPQALQNLARPSQSPAPRRGARSLRGFRRGAEP